MSLIEEIPWRSRSTANDETRNALHDFIARTLRAMSTPGADVRSFFSASDIAVAGSGIDEFAFGPEEVVALATEVSSWGLDWQAQAIACWRRDDIAWAQIRIGVTKIENGTTVVVPYVATGVFAWEDGAWSWLYWGGGEPQVEARV